jgi:signal transduction histidine kinase
MSTVFSSIRWRLVASYSLIALLTVSLVGVLALSLVSRYVRQQQMDYLTSNAQAIAHQALPLMRPVIQRAGLLELANTASFFVNARVRILDAQQRVLVDSGLGRYADEFVWIAPAERLRFELEAPLSAYGPVIIAMPGSDQDLRSDRLASELTLLKGLPPDAQITVVRRIGGPWGSRIVFSTPSKREVTGLPWVDANELQPPAQEEGPRSQQVILTPIGLPSHPVGFVELGSSPDFGAEMLLTTGRALFLAAMGATLLAVILGMLVSRGLTRPLHSLSAAAGRMSHGDWSARAPAHGRGEIGQLAAQFNQMADRLQANFAELAAERDALRRFIADASHELRTPITALKTFNELLQGPAADEPSTRDEFLAESQVQLDRLEWITLNLLDLSRLDAGLAHLDMAEHALGELIETAVGAFKNLAQEKSIHLSITGRLPQLTLRCDRARLESALANLLDNAVKFTPAGGHVEIGAEQTEASVRIWVQDDGPGIDVQDQPHIFERFYRGQAGHPEGSGLGLAIVQSVAQAHAGRVWVDSQPQQGSRFTIELPVNRQS